METNNIRYILADEVGLGKTIEACLLYTSVPADAGAGFRFPVGFD